LQRLPIKRLRIIQLTVLMRLDGPAQHGDHAMIDIRRMALVPCPAGRRSAHPGIRRSFMIGFPTSFIAVLLAAVIGVAPIHLHATPMSCMPSFS
jgi:hypothetical protein